MCLSTPRTLWSLWLNHRITKDFLKAGVMEALACKQPVSGYSVRVWILNHVFLWWEKDRLTWQGHISRSLSATEMKFHPRLCGRYSFSIFYTFLIWLLGWVFLNPIYMPDAKSDVNHICGNWTAFYYFLFCRIIILLDCNATYIHSHSIFSFTALVHRYVGWKLTCYFWYCYLCNDALVLHSVLCLLCFFNATYVSMY